jgi:hypothetical protein
VRWKISELRFQPRPHDDMAGGAAASKWRAARVPGRREIWGGSGVRRKTSTDQNQRSGV